MSLLPPRETWSLDTAYIGRRVLFFDQLDSTNTTAAELLANPESQRGGDDTDDLVVIADFQTAGRGQYGRVWQSRPGSSLLMSVALRPPPQLRRPVILTAFAAVAIGEAILTLTGVQAKIKWPNDLLIRGKKVCGILIENTTSLVVGIGLNLNQTAEEFTQAELPDATSLAIVRGEPPGLPPWSFQPSQDHGDKPRGSQGPSLEQAARVVVQKLDLEYGRLLAGERVAVEADWKWRIGLLGKQVTAELTDGTAISGRLHEMSFDGLELDTGDAGWRVLVPETVRQLRPIAESV
ncbi:MAG: biotin--[acetyl-CoA-carboxylase] ligase [Planctomycetes bacterium]|nr:biotin--[acetyl-CoA-carboxylase] ligase [Planctomycetota bacterium]